MTFAIERCRCKMESAWHHSRKPKVVAGSRSRSPGQFAHLDKAKWKVEPWHETKAYAMASPFFSEATVAVFPEAPDRASAGSEACEWAWPSISKYLHANPFEKSAGSGPYDSRTLPRGTVLHPVVWSSAAVAGPLPHQSPKPWPLISKVAASGQNRRPTRFGHPVPWQRSRSKCLCVSSC